MVSVIIPCYNVEQYIEECIVSVINQTYKEIEIICIDNNSTDATPDKLLQLQKQYSQLIIDKELRSGAPAARNKGLSISKGDWIQFLDADDLLLPNKIQHQINLISQTNVAVIAGAYKRRYVKDIEVEITQLNNNKYIAPFINQSGITSSILWNKNALNKIIGWNEKLKSSQEADLMLRLVLNENEFKTDLVPLTIVRERESGQISQRDPAEKWKQYIDVRLKYMQTLENKHPKIFMEYKNIYAGFLLISIITLSKYNKQEALSIYNTSVKPILNFNIKNPKELIIKLVGLNVFLLIKKIAG